jgi:hypothetical protein
MLTKVRVTPFIVLAMLFFMVGCTSQKSQWKADIGQELDRAQSAINNLESNLSLGTIRNALLLKSYADALKRQNPDAAGVVDVLVQDASWDGPMVKSLKERFQRAEDESQDVINRGEKDVKRVLTELGSIANASSPVLYGLMLSDPINVIADMSNGKLGRVESMSKSASMSANGEADYGSGSQLVGNPNYGNWQTNSGGQSFWAWYGMYSLFGNMFGRPIYYNDWSHRRPYSYYSDHGRNYYSSPSQKRSQSSVQTTAEKKFKQQGKSFKSPYAKSRTGGATTAAVTSRATSASRYASSSRNTSSKRSSSKSRFSSSQRSSSYKTSRSFGGGK